MFLNAVILNSLSFALGVLSSLVVWWILNKFWIPSVRFGEEICKYSVAGDKSLYVCAFENSGTRTIIDAEVVTRIGVRKFENSENWIFFSVRTNASRIPSLGPTRRALIRIFDERKSPSYIDYPPANSR